VEVHPQHVAARSEMEWRGLTAEVVQITENLPFKCGFSASCHLLIVAEQGIMVDGETRVEGVVTSTRRDLARTLSFVPAGHVFSGSFVPRVPPRGGHLYIDPALPVADPELDFAHIEFEPRLFFDEPSLWVTSQKILHLVRDGGDNRLYAETLAAMLAIELVRFRDRGGLRPPVARGGLAEWQRRAAIEFINDSLDQNISLEDLANLVRLSPNHFCQAFARSMGMPPHQYQRRQRVERAKLLLADTDRSVTEVAMAVGYSAPSNFATAFRRVTGLTPRDFRRRLL
jgi:AraC family transcriptional regulator